MIQLSPRQLLRRGFILSITLLFWCLFTMQSANAQQRSTRPKIGLTLSGGGAKGFAHIGIVQALDSAGLKVDYITGTSMGSVVGGLYASGYSGDSIESIARTLDWGLLFSTAPKLSAISIEEKDEFNKYALEIPFRKGKFKIGTGIIEGQELWLKFAELFHPVYDITNFADLSIPFKCIGTDLSTGNAVVMDKGNIITCIRASMAIPSVFTPVQYEGKTLVDGGVVNNFPVLDVKDMGADFVIGVNLNKGLRKAEDLHTMFDVLLQLAFFKDATTFEEHKKKCDIYISPELYGHGASSFDASDSIIDIGKQYGRMYYPIFKRMADSLNALYPTLPFVKNRLPKAKSININSYEVVGLKNTTSKFFLGLSGLQNNMSFSNKNLTESIRTVFGSRYYRKINYDFIKVDSGKTNLRFDVDENLLTAVKFGLNYNTFTKLSLIFDITSRDLLFKESRALATVSLSENPRLYLEYYKYLGKTRRYGLNLSYFKENIDYPIYRDFSLYEPIRSLYSFFDLRLQYTINRKSYVGLSQQINYSRVKTTETPEITFNASNTYWHTYFSYQFSSVDKKYFTSSGWKIKTEVGYVYGQSPSYSTIDNGVETAADTILFNGNNYGRLFLKVDHYRPLSSKFVFFQNASVGYIVSDNPFVTNAFQVGGVGENLINQVSFYGLDEAEVKKESIASVLLGLQYKLAKSVYLTARVNFGLYGFHGIAFNELTASKNLLSGYGLTLGRFKSCVIALDWLHHVSFV